MAKGDGGGSAFGSVKPQMGQSNFRQQMPGADQSKPAGWQHLINPQFANTANVDAAMNDPGFSQRNNIKVSGSLDRPMQRNMGGIGSFMKGQRPNMLQNAGRSMGQMGQMMGNHYGQQKQEGGNQFNVNPNMMANLRSRMGGNTGFNPQAGMFGSNQGGSGGRMFGHPMGRIFGF